MPNNIIKHDQVIADSWQLLAADATLEQAQQQSRPIVPLRLWHEQPDALQEIEELGVWLESDEAVEEIATDLSHFSLVALNFPTFTDGRHFSSARLLRERYSYAGEVRAIGDVLRDQLFFMQRCGFDAYAIRSDRCPHDALKSLKDFSVSYQAATDKRHALIQGR